MTISNSEVSLTVVEPVSSDFGDAGSTIIVNETTGDLYTRNLRHEVKKINDAANSSFLQSGSGAISRTVQAKLRDIISLDDFSTSAQYDTAAQATIGGGNKLALPTTQFYKQGTGVAQIELIGTATRYAQFRCTGDGTDDGDLLFYQTGDNVWFQSLTDTYRQTVSITPKGTVTVAPANLELNGTDIQADATNYEKLRIHSMGTTEDAHEIISEKGGTGTVRPIHIFLGGIANGIFLNASGFNGVGTKTPRVKWDILADSAAQLRLSQADNSKYVDFQVDASSNLTITPQGSGEINIPCDLDVTTTGIVKSTATNLKLQTTAGGGVVWLATASGVQVQINDTASVANFVTMTGAASGANPSIGVTAENLLFGSGSALATTATAGYVMFPSCAGTPTGVPTGQGAGKIPMIFDTSGVKLWFYTGGSWKGVVVA